MEGKQFYLNITTLNEEGKKESKTIYVSEEVYRAYKQPYWKAKQQERRASRCIIDGHRCMGDCSKCDRLRDGAPLSLEQMAEDGIDVPSSYETPERVLPGPYRTGRAEARSLQVDSGILRNGRLPDCRG